jgi:hypothetical protein
MDLKDVFGQAVDSAMALLPERMDTPEARVLLAAIALQESRLIHRRQINGPARGLWQFEVGGVRGVCNHAASSMHLRRVCKLLRVDFLPAEIQEQLEFDDVLAAAVARLLLWTDPHPIPAIGEVDAAWGYYLRNWRPGKPKRATWGSLYRQAVEVASDE